ncbi:MAG TPA: hypothetical protein VLH84_01995 [Patescibacteria group bacterium]|nr:hypothetical protein [Patescibacteria group bacterium]
MYAPDLLYRGVILDPAIADDPHTLWGAVTAEGGLQPGSLRMNDKGEQCVSTGDEYGVYMTPSRSMANNYTSVSLRDQRLGLGRPYLVDGEPVAYTTPDDELGTIRAVLQTPSLGILYAIRTEGLQGLRLPRYREGREVTADELALIPEWIADEVPQENAHPLSVIVGPDIVAGVRRSVLPNLGEVGMHSKVSTTLAIRMGGLAFVAQQLLRLSDRHDPNEVARVLALARSLC